VEPTAKDLISVGESQLQIAPNLDDSLLQAHYGPLPPTPLEQGLRKTLTMFRDQLAAGTLDVADLG
jgi:hypothetical protein